MSHSVNTVGNQVLNNKIGTDPTGTSGPAYATQRRRRDPGRGRRPPDRGPGEHRREQPERGGHRDRQPPAPGHLDPGGGQLHRGHPGRRRHPQRRLRHPHHARARAAPTPPRRSTRPSPATRSPTTRWASASRAPAPPATRITDNSIHDNTGLGIDIAPIGQVNQNDVGDTDTGPNTLLNWPELTGATHAHGVRHRLRQLHRRGVRHRLPRPRCPANLQTSYGEGETLLSSTTAAPDGSFIATLPPSTNGRIVTATATDASGNTSEFARNIAVPGTNGAPVAAFKATCPNLGCSFDAVADDRPRRRRHHVVHAGPSATAARRRGPRRPTPTAPPAPTG